MFAYLLKPRLGLVRPYAVIKAAPHLMKDTAGNAVSLHTTRRNRLMFTRILLLVNGIIGLAGHANSEPFPLPFGLSANMPEAAVVSTLSAEGFELIDRRTGTSHFKFLAVDYNNEMTFFVRGYSGSGLASILVRNSSVNDKSSRKNTFITGGLYKDIGLDLGTSTTGEKVQAGGLSYSKLYSVLQPYISLPCGGQVSEYQAGFSFISERGMYISLYFQSRPGTEDKARYLKSLEVSLDPVDSSDRSNCEYGGKNAPPLPR